MCIRDSLNRLSEDGVLEDYEGYFVFDADNILQRNYVEEMNKVFNSGYEVVTSYRNSKNFGANWISFGYGLWFLHEAEFLNKMCIRDRDCTVRENTV